MFEKQIESPQVDVTVSSSRIAGILYFCCLDMNLFHLMYLTSTF